MTARWLGLIWNYLRIWRRISDLLGRFKEGYEKSLRKEKLKKKRA
jgi:hypothetical protein